MSDIFNHSSGRTSRKVTAPPGGTSSVSFGTSNGPLSPGAKVIEPAVDASTATIVDTEVTQDGAASQQTTEDAADAAASTESLESIKLKAMAKIASISKDSAAVKTALLEMIQKLEAAGVHVPQPVEADAALSALQNALKSRGVHGIISLGRMFRTMDDDHDNKISFDEFKKALSEYQVALSEQDLHRLFRFFDTDCSGYLSFNELLFGLRGKLNDRRAEMVKLAFKVLDKEGTGQVTLADVEKRYDASQHPEVILGVKTAQAVFLEFMETFEAYGGGEKGDGIITAAEFERYYGALSSNIDNDDYFELVIRNAWHISGGEGWCANTTCKRVLVLHEDGSQSVQEVKDDFDINTKDVESVKKALMEQGVKDIKGVALYAMPTFSAAEAQAPSPRPVSATPQTPGSSNRRNVMGSSIVFG